MDIQRLVHRCVVDFHAQNGFCGLVGRKVTQTAVSMAPDAGFGDAGSSDPWRAMLSHLHSWPKVGLNKFVATAIGMAQGLHSRVLDGFAIPGCAVQTV